jgi:hypothetical protein
MKSFRGHLDEKAEALPRSHDVRVRPKDRRHLVANALTVMFKKHTKYRRGSEAYDLTMVEPKGSRKYKGTVARRTNAKGKPSGWVAGMEATRGRKTTSAVGSTTSKNNLLAIRKAYEAAAKAIGQSAVAGARIIGRGNAMATRVRA